MTITRHATVRAIPRWSLVQAVRRWATSDAGNTPVGRRARRSRRRTPFVPVPAPSLAVWEMDRSELTAVLEASRW